MTLKKLKKLAVIIVLAIITILPHSQLLAQCPHDDKDGFERAAWVLGASLTFSFVDYVGFNLIKKASGGSDWSGTAPISYRLGMGALQAAISYFLYKECGLSSAISFNLIWWTWGDDFGYYGWGQLLSWFPWESRAQSGLRFTEYNSAGWTPIGLTRPQGSLIAKSTLVAQAVIGLSASIAIIW